MRHIFILFFLLLLKDGYGSDVPDVLKSRTNRPQPAADLTNTQSRGVHTDDVVSCLIKGNTRMIMEITIYLFTCLSIQMPGVLQSTAGP